MPTLPSPGTLSPGKLKLLYDDGTLFHEVGSNFAHGQDITDVPTIRTEAIAIAGLLGPCLTNTNTVRSWKIVNPSGVTLYEEALVTPVVGSTTGFADDILSQSASVALTGKGAPPVGFKQGQTKFTVFCGYYSPGHWTLPTQPVATMPGFTALRNHLNSSTVVGCDFFGQSATWRTTADLQINAHFQKRWGI